MKGPFVSSQVTLQTLNGLWPRLSAKAQPAHTPSRGRWIWGPDRAERVAVGCVSALFHVLTVDIRLLYLFVSYFGWVYICLIFG